jgi:hypothetical protein
MLRKTKTISNDIIQLNKKDLTKEQRKLIKELKNNDLKKPIHDPRKPGLI